MEKYKYNKSSKNRFSDALKYERAKLMYQYYHKEGYTLERVGRIFGLTRERVRQILQGYEDSQKQQKLIS
jgi:DNA-directed RNA polymerase sigma subunit (sigma70/sigma32)